MMGLNRSWLCFGILLYTLITSACSSHPKLNTKPIKWTDPDNRPILQPLETKENQIWDIVDHTLFYPLKNVLDLNWTGRKLGNLLNVADERQADNVNALDEAVNSSWFTNRHFLLPLSVDELMEGPGVAQPDTAGSWEIVAGKFEGGTAGFTVRDAAGDLYLLKFDSQDNNEMGSSAEVIATKILHASGYNVPRNSIVYFHPSRLIIGQKTTVPDGKGGKRPMLEADKQAILSNIIPQADGTLRCVASKFLDGVPAGVFNYHGRRRDDPNDLVKHHHRRELRGLRVISSWMNDADRRAANTLDMYVTDADGRRYLKHYLIDMGSTFGSNNLMPHPPKYGNEYVWDPRTITRSLISLGFYRKPWEEPLSMKHSTLGYFENQTFRPDGWVPTYPNPAFRNCTGRDGYWGAKLVMAFSDADIAAMVKTGRFSNLDVESELVRLLIERRDMIGRYWFSRVNPLDLFWIDPAHLGFQDLAVNGNLASSDETTYAYVLLDHQGRTVEQEQMLNGQPRIPLHAGLETGAYYGYEVRTRRGSVASWSLPVRVYFYAWKPGHHQIVRVERED